MKPYFSPSLILLPHLHLFYCVLKLHAGSTPATTLLVSIVDADALDVDELVHAAGDNIWHKMLKNGASVGS